MQLLLTHSEYTQFLLERIVEGPKHAMFATYGVFAGILPSGYNIAERGGEYASGTQDILRAMRDVPDVKILVGMSDYASCRKSRCMDCERQYVEKSIRVLQHVDTFPQFTWRLATHCHLKACLFFYENTAVGVTGGRNFTNSQWDDVSFTLDIPSIRTLYSHLMSVWHLATPATSAAIDGLLLRGGITSEHLREIYD